MARWRAEAIRLLPELRDDIQRSPTIVSLWCEVWFAFENAYDEPRNEDLIRRIYTFASWCSGAPQDPAADHDPATAATVCFYEDIATCKAARQDMPRWFRASEIESAPELWGYHLKEAEYQKLLEHMRANAHLYARHPKRRK